MTTSIIHKNKLTTPTKLYTPWPDLLAQVQDTFYFQDGGEEYEKASR